MGAYAFCRRETGRFKRFGSASGEQSSLSSGSRAALQQSWRRRRASREPPCQRADAKAPHLNGPGRTWADKEVDNDGCGDHPQYGLEETPEHECPPGREQLGDRFYVAQAGPVHGKPDDSGKEDGGGDENDVHVVLCVREPVMVTPVGGGVALMGASLTSVDLCLLLEAHVPPMRTRGHYICRPTTV